MAGVEEKDTGWDAIKKQLEEFELKAVKVGIQSGDTTADGKESLAYVAWLHEFGSPGGMIPQRSFIRAGMEEKQGDIESKYEELGPAIFNAGANAEQMLNILGQEATAIIQNKITSGPFTPDSPETIRRKGSSSPLIDTGHMRASVRHVVCDAGDISDD